MKPYNTCGSCPVWLAAFEGDGLDDWDEILEACRMSGCAPSTGEDFVLCRYCMNRNECLDKESRDGCYLGLEEEDEDD